MKKIKILHCFGKMDKGGAETLIINVFRKISKEKYQFDFLVASKDEGEYDSEIKKLGGNIYCIPLEKNVFGLYKYIKQLKKLIIHNQYDVVHSHVHFFSGIIVKVAKQCGVKKLIVHSHNISDGKPNTIVREIYRSVMRSFILKNSSYLLGCSLEAIEHLYGKKDDPRIIKINNGIDIEQFSNLTKKREEILKDLNIPEDSFVVGHIGRFEKQKNHEFLVEIFKEILDRKSNSYLVLVGKGVLESVIKEKITKYGIGDNVRLLGTRNDIPEILNSFDVFVFPSLYEGLGMVLIEAQALGIPCFVSDKVPCEANLGLDNYIVLSLDQPPSYWAEVILNSPLKRYMDGAKRVIEKGYDIRETVEKIEMIYNSNI